MPKTTSESPISEQGICLPMSVHSASSIGLDRIYRFCIDVGRRIRQKGDDGLATAQDHLHAAVTAGDIFVTTSCCGCLHRRLATRRHYTWWPVCRLPIKIAGELRAYQKEGVNWLAFLRHFGLHGVLADDMGE